MQSTILVKLLVHVSILNLSSHLFNEKKIDKCFNKFVALETFMLKHARTKNHANLRFTRQISNKRSLAFFATQNYLFATVCVSKPLFSLPFIVVLVF